VLDIVHVLEYLWRAAYAFHADGTPEAEAWVEHQLVKLLANASGGAIANVLESMVSEVMTIPGIRSRIVASSRNRSITSSERTSTSKPSAVRWRSRESVARGTLATHAGSPSTIDLNSAARPARSSDFTVTSS